MTVTALAAMFVTVVVVIMRKIQRVITGPNPKAVLLHKVYSDSGHCEGHADTTYKTPFGSCYSLGGTYEFFDEILEWDRNGMPTQYRHSFYYGKNESCQDLVEGVGIEGSIEFCSGFGDSSEYQSVVVH